MADIIDLIRRKKPESELLASRPLEFRRGDWLSGSVILCTREESEKFEARRQDAPATPGRVAIPSLPSHFTLDGGCNYTAISLFRLRADESLMRRLYRLAGLMECITRAPSPVLRTDLVRRFFKIIQEERERLNVSWKGNVHNFLLPLMPEHYQPSRFLNSMQGAASLKDLLSLIDEETGRQFDILALHYVFYMPEALCAQ